MKEKNKKLWGIAISIFVIASNASLLPNVFREIFSGAFRLRAAAGGAAGFGIREAIRYGVTRGIFSNEAGCGTSPTAHASANVDSPHKQGCFGIFEVVFDTLILCTLTAVVVLIGKTKFGISGAGGVSDTLLIFEKCAGSAAYFIIGLSVVLFAYATVIAQLFYGRTALRFMTGSHAAQIALTVLTVGAAAIGPFTDTRILWIAADTVIGIMTVINVSALLALSGKIASESRRGLALRSKKRHANK
jgi:AGCS family alanine or glycine:cation symporter